VRLERLMLGLFLMNGSMWHGLAAAEDGAGKSLQRATLSNGLQVVVVQDRLAPVVTVELSVLAGGEESPAEYPGLAHAQEHMAFRGCAGMTSDQTAAIYTQLGGQNDADTDKTVTQYYATVPSSDLDLALRAQAACMKEIEDSEEEWQQERGAIEQEVAEDLSDSLYRLFTKVEEDMFANSPYAQDPLGSKDSFDALNASMLRDFQRKWYAPNNEILVIAGDVDPRTTLDSVVRLFGELPRHELPSRPAVVLGPVKAETFHLAGDCPYVDGVIAFRLPGTRSPDYAALRVLVDILDGSRSKIERIESSGKILGTDFDLAEQYPEASVGYGLVELPRGADPARFIRGMRRVLEGYGRHGVTDEQVNAAKRNELRTVEFQRSSIPGLAKVWSDALATEGLNSPDDAISAIEEVTASDVDRLARRYLIPANEVIGILVPSSADRLVAAKKAGDDENIIVSPSMAVELPSWADDDLEQLHIPETENSISDTVLPNGIRLIIKTDATSPTVLLRGSVKRTVQLQPDTKLAWASTLLEGLYDGGTRRMRRAAFEQALDDISAEETAGYTFSLKVLKTDISRGVQLLAEHELDPDLRFRDFRRVKRQTSRTFADRLLSAEALTEAALAHALLPSDDPAPGVVKPNFFKSVDLGTVKRCLAETIRPDLTTIVIVGDISAEEARAVIEKWFDGWKAIGPAPSTVLPRVPPNKASTVYIADSTSSQEEVVLAEQLDLDRLDPDYYPLRLGNAILGGNSEATRLFHDLRQVTGLVYNVDLDLDATQTRSLFSIRFGSAPENTARVRALIERDLEQMRDTEVSASELHQAKAYFLRQIPLNESSQEDVVEGLLSRAELGLPLDEMTRDAQKYLKLNASDVMKAFRKHIRSKDLVEVARGPLDE
jgi:zinc protease